MSAEARARLAARVASDYAEGGHRTFFIPDLNDVAAVGDDVVAAAVTTSEQAAASAANAELVQATVQGSDTILARLGAIPNNQRPFLVWLQGQSNAFGAGTGGNRVIDQSGGGARLYSNLSGGPSGNMVLFQDGTAPYNGVANNILAGIVNEIRAKGIIPASRPIWVACNALGGRPISDWMGTGTSSIRYVAGVEQLDRMQAIWVAEGGTGTLKIDHMHWQQGEADSTTAGPNNTRDAYLAAWDVFKAQLLTLPYWTSETTITVSEMGRWRPYISSDTATLGAPGNARNDAMRVIGGGRDPKTSLISTYSLPNTDTLSANYSHFSGASLIEIGKRAVAAFVSLRAGNPQTFSRTPEGWPDVRMRRLSPANATSLILGVDDVASGFHLDCAAADIRLPGLDPNEGVFGWIEVWSQTSGLTVLRPANDAQTMWDTDGSLVSTVSIGVGKYLLTYSRGRWAVFSMNKATALKDLSSLASGTARVITSAEALACCMGAFNNKISLPTAQAGTLIAVTCRSLTGGNTVIGRSIVSYGIAAGGIGYTVGDVLTMPLGIGTGDPATFTVATVNGAGAILTGSITYAGHITSVAAPTSPCTPTGGTGTGASLTQTVGTGNIYDGVTAVGAYTLSAANQTVLLVGNGAGWRVVLDTAKQGKGPAWGGALNPSSLTVGQCIANAVYQCSAGAYVLCNPNSASGSTTTLQAIGGAITVSSASGGIFGVQTESLQNVTIRAGQTAVFAPVSSGRWAIIGGTILTSDPPLQIQTPASGSTINIPSPTTVVINPAADIANLTIALFASPTDKDEVWLYFQKAVTGVITWSSGTPVPGFTTAAAGLRVRLIYSTTLGSWI